MNPLVKKLISFIFFVSWVVSFAVAQIVAVDADKTVFTDTIAGRVDPVYVFCSSAFAGDDTLAGLTAQTPGAVTAHGAGLMIQLMFITRRSWLKTG